MKNTPEEIIIMEKMQPGVLSKDGFLGDDQRALNEIIASDLKIISKFSITKEKISERLEYFTKLSYETYEDFVVIENKFKVSYYSVRGRVLSPFKSGKVFPKGEITLENLENKLIVKWTPLSVHMIGEFGFFEGKGSKYRLDPEILISAIF